MHEAEVPILRMVQVRETAVDQRPHEVQGERGALVPAQQQLRIRLPFRRAETGTIDIVAAVGGQRHPVAGLGIRRARLGVLTGEPSDPDDGLLHALQQHQAHLQEDLQALGDIVGFAVLEALRAIASLQKKGLAALCLCQLRAQGLDLPGDHERRQAAQRRNRPLESNRVLVSGLLRGRPALPARGMPMGQNRGFGHAGDATQGLHSVQSRPAFRAEWAGIPCKVAPRVRARQNAAQNPKGIPPCRKSPPSCRRSVLAKRMPAPGPAAGATRPRDP